MPEVKVVLNRVAASETTRKRRRMLVEEDDEVDEFSKAVNQKIWRSYEPAAATTTVPTEDTATMTSVDVAKQMPHVEGRWKPDEGRAPQHLDEAPVFFPDEEEFEDPLKYIASVRSTAEACGICRIVPPRTWRPPCFLKDESAAQKFRFSTRIQQLHKLQRRTTRSTNSYDPDASESAETHFGFELGPEITLADFKKYADDFKGSYFANKGVSVDAVEGEYWRIVEDSTEKVEVLYGADLDTAVLGSGFPKRKRGPVKNGTYEKSGWNLNNIARLPGSMLTYEESSISGVVVPWLYIGMCLSSFCWHVEDHFFYSINYMHFGEPKIWYGVPRTSAFKLEETMKKHLPDLFKEQPDLLHKLVTQFSPSVLKEEGVPVYRAVQRAGDFVVTFPRAYHCGFNTGFNCAEAVNFAPIDWFSHGQAAVELYKKYRRKTSVSHDKLLLTAVQHCLGAKEHLDRAHPFWRTTLDDAEVLSALISAFKARVHSEHSRRSWLGEVVRTRKMDSDFDFEEERECLYCHFDLHLSAISCDCSPRRYTCLEHLDLLCACPKERKHALYRYEIQDLYGFKVSLDRALKDISREPQTDLSGASGATMSHSKHKTLSVGSAFEQPIRQLKSEGERAAGSHSSSRMKKPPATCDVVVLSDDEEQPEVKPSPVISEPDYTVELIDVGTLPLGGWCSKDSIFPAGFKSRILYYNFLDFPRLAHYVSEIVDCAVGHPYFKVTLESQPTHSFVDLSIHQCWRSVQRRLVFEAQSRRKLGNFNLPDMRPIEKINGVDMFGLSNPAIKQVVENLDFQKVCSEYWLAKHSKDSTQQQVPYEVLKELFTKGTISELWTLHRVFSSDWGTAAWKQGSQALADVLESLLESSTTK